MKLFGSLFFSSLLLSLGGCQTKPTFNFGAYSEAERLYEKKQYPKAIAKYEEYVRENPEGNMAVISYYSMAKSYEALSQTDQAREFYEKIVREYPEEIWSDFAKSRLKELK